MRFTRLTLAALTVLAASVCAAGAAPDAASARAFVQKIYAHYPQPANGPVFSPTDKNAADVFDPGMVALFKEDVRLAKGEVGFVDADPLCQCQDDSGLKAKILSVTMKGAGAAIAVVDLRFPGGGPNPLTLHLVAVNGAWRIADLSSKDTASYRADFIKANKEHAAGHW
ncbi:MAG TPA: DUF3828 domain-containing protein [Rhizomicrobium sp.]|jgi:hypothetical protein|nr:DUF3828 domain-containing protein [Rhizomicrobium sp.]